MRDWRCDAISANDLERTRRKEAPKNGLYSLGGRLAIAQQALIAKCYPAEWTPTVVLVPVKPMSNLRIGRRLAANCTPRRAAINA
jgi:hypothetical protein